MPDFFTHGLKRSLFPSESCSIIFCISLPDQSTAIGANRWETKTDELHRRRCLARGSEIIQLHHENVSHSKLRHAVYNGCKIFLKMSTSHTFLLFPPILDSQLYKYRVTVTSDIGDTDIGDNGVSRNFFWSHCWKSVHFFGYKRHGI